MALNLKKIPKNGNGGGFRQPPIENGSYPARVVQFLDLGLQPQQPYKGQEKPPIHKVSITYELLDEFCVDEDGNELEDKPRWISEDFPLYSLENEKARSTKRYNALDPNGDFDGDITQVVNVPCVVTVVQNPRPNDPENPYCNVGNVSTMRPKEANKAEELKNPPVVFTLEDPDLEVFNKLPQFLQDKIKGNLDFEGSPLQELLDGKGKKAAVKKTKPVKQEPVEEEAEEEEDNGEW